MTQGERRSLLLRELLNEQPDFENLPVPQGEAGQNRLLRTLMNRRGPWPVSREFLQMQDLYLKEETRKKGIVALTQLTPVKRGLYLWRGDITTLACDGIVNAANSGLLGCFLPCHHCIDNAIHTYAGVQLRLACAALMKEQGHEEPVGRAKLTPAFNLPSRFILHTVGPAICGDLRQEDCDALASCYRSCLALAEEQGLHSLAFCCLSTGEFHFPNAVAAQIAVQAVEEFLKSSKSHMEVIFNVYKESDERLYRELLSGGKAAE